jgi:mRNA interferase RelE/StbE
MVYRIEVKASAIKALARIPNPHQRRIAKAIDGLARTPRPTGCVKLAGAENVYRIRVGDYRIVYDIVDRVLTVYVIRIAHRKDVYRGL